MVGADAEVFEVDGRHKRCADWRHSTDADNDQNRKEMKEAPRKITEPSFKTHDCSACECGATQQHRGQHSTPCRQVVHVSGVALSVCKVKYDSDGRRVRVPGDSAEEPQAKKAKTEAPDPATFAHESGAASSSTTRRRTLGKDLLARGWASQRRREPGRTKRTRP